MSCLISVIIPTYNRADMIGRAVRSVLEQEHPELEIIVVDDVSRDDTRGVVEEIKDNRIAYVRREKNGGAGAARNTGINLAKGEYVCFLDSDDEYRPSALSSLLYTHKNLCPRPGLVFSNCLERGGTNRTYIPEKAASGFVVIDKKFPASLFCAPSCWMLSRDGLGKERFDERLWTKEDMDFFARLVRREPVYFLNRTLTVKHVHSFKAGSVPIEHAEYTGALMLEKWGREMAKDRKFMTDFCCAMTKDLGRSGRKKQAFNYARRALSVSPFSGRAWKSLFRSLCV